MVEIKEFDAVVKIDDNESQRQLIENDGIPVIDFNDDGEPDENMAVAVEMNGEEVILVFGNK